MQDGAPKPLVIDGLQHRGWPEAIWSREVDYGEGSRDLPGWPEPPARFRSNRDFPGLAAGLRRQGFAEEEVSRILGRNWLDFFERSFGPGNGTA